MDREKQKGYFVRLGASIMILFMASSYVSAGATAVLAVVCPILIAIQTVLVTMASALVAVMFVYGGIKYTFSADDPGGRKAGKNTCIHAVIGGILVLVATSVVDMIGLIACPAI